MGGSDAAGAGLQLELKRALLAMLLEPVAGSTPSPLPFAILTPPEHFPEWHPGGTKWHPVGPPGWWGGASKEVLE